MCALILVFVWVRVIIFLFSDVALNEFECPCVHAHVPHETCAQST